MFVVQLPLALALAAAAVAPITVALSRRRCCRYVAILGRRHHAAQRAPIEHQHGRAALQPRIAALALPVPVARLAQRHIAVGVLVAQRCGEQRFA